MGLGLGLLLLLLLLRHLVHAVLDVHGLDVAVLIKVCGALARRYVRVARAAVGTDARLLR